MNQKGFATTTLLALLPLLLSIAAFAAGSFFIMHENRRALFECRAGLIDAQQRLVGAMNQLLQLNPQAKSLRMQKVAAQSALAAAATNPAVAAAAEASLASIRARQVALDGLQRSIIAKGNTEARVRTREVAKKVSDDISNVQLPKMAVKPKDADLAPEYDVTPEVEQKHTISISWVFQPLKVLPDWLNEILKQHPLKLNAQCSTTSEKGEDKWKPRLKRVKPL